MDFKATKAAQVGMSTSHPMIDKMATFPHRRLWAGYRITNTKATIHQHMLVTMTKTAGDDKGLSIHIIRPIGNAVSTLYSIRTLGLVICIKPDHSQLPKTINTPIKMEKYSTDNERTPQINRGKRMAAVNKRCLSTGTLLYLITGATKAPLPRTKRLNRPF